MKTRQLVINISDGWVEAKSADEVEAKEISNRGGSQFLVHKGNEGLPVNGEVQDCGHILNPSKGDNIHDSFDDGTRFYIKAITNGSIVVFSG